MSFTAGVTDTAGHFMGGTEIRVLTVHGGRLYAGNGYWQDQAGAEGLQGAQILALDAAGAGWRVEHAFAERLPTGGMRDFAVSALRSVRFTTGPAGALLPSPVGVLVASTWDLTGASRVFSRVDGTATWAGGTLAQDRPTKDVLPQIRSFGMHRDRRTGVDMIFAGHGPRGIFSGTYEDGRIVWASTPELDVKRLAVAGFSGLAGRLRISAFAECNGILYAAVGQQIYQRVDGSDAAWQLVYTNPNPGHSETGLRGLTATANPAGSGEVLLAAVEGTAGRIIRFDPLTGAETTELDLREFLASHWGMPVGYVIAAYNDMARASDHARDDALLIGLEAFIPPRAPVPADHTMVDVGYGRVESGGWYLVRRPDARYDLRQITAAPPAAGRPLVATRAILASPFADDANAIFFAGYDANKAAAHNTGWIARADRSRVFDPVWRR